MGKKEKGYLNLPPAAERDYRLLMADKLLTALSPETRMDIFKTAFLEAAKDYNDEAAFSIICVIGREYYLKEREIADKTDRHYGDAHHRADKTLGDYLRGVYWELPENKEVYRGYSGGFGTYKSIYIPTLLKTKSYILKICVGQWAGYYNGRRYFEELSDESRPIFSFLINAYNGLEFKRYVSKEEKEEILKLFREKTDSAFTPEIAEKWLAWQYSTIPEEIKKIFIIARAKNGGMELLRREVKYAEILKPLDVENRSDSALKFNKEFCLKLAEVDTGIQQLMEEFGTISLGEAEKLEFQYINLNEINLNIRFREDRLPYSGLSWERRVSQLGFDIHKFLCQEKYRVGLRIKIRFIFQEGQYWRGCYDDVVYLRK